MTVIKNPLAPLLVSAAPLTSTDRRAELKSYQRPDAQRTDRVRTPLHDRAMCDYGAAVSYSTCAGLTSERSAGGPGASRCALRVARGYQLRHTNDDTRPTGQLLGRTERVVRASPYIDNLEPLVASLHQPPVHAVRVHSGFPLLPRTTFPVEVARPREVRG